MGLSTANWSTWSLIQTTGWIVAIQNAISAYDKLPKTNPPGCYICTAAQHGHAFLVRSESLNGIRVNTQLRTLKAGEIALRTILPRLHAMSRYVYDRLGPPLARRITNPWLADAAYLGLKPAEWLARAALALFGATKLAQNLYQSPTILQSHTGDTI